MKYRKAIGNRQFTKDPERPERPRVAEALAEAQVEGSKGA